MDYRRSSHQKWSIKKGVLKNFAKFTGKHLRQGLLFYRAAPGCFCAVVDNRVSMVTHFPFLYLKTSKNLVYI